MKRKIHFLVRNEGTVLAVWPVTKEAKIFVKDKVQLESWQRLGINGFAVDHRMFGPLHEGMLEVGRIKFI